MVNFFIDVYKNNAITENIYTINDNKLKIKHPDPSNGVGNEFTFERESPIEEGKDLIIGTWKKDEGFLEFKDDGTCISTTTDSVYNYYWEKTEETLELTNSKYSKYETEYNYEVDEDSLTLTYVNHYSVMSFERF